MSQATKQADMHINLLATHVNCIFGLKGSYYVALAWNFLYSIKKTVALNSQS